MAGILLAASLPGRNPVTLSGGTYNAGNMGADAYSYFIVDQNGNTYKRANNDTPIQVNTTDDWIRPTSEAPGTYQVRVTNVTGDLSFWSSTSAEDAWYTLSTSDWFVWVWDSTIGFGGKSITFDVEIRKGTGPTLASTSYTLSADREDN